MKTYSLKQKDIQRNWLIIDAKDQVVGRIATVLANVVTGKHKAGYSRHIDNGDYVVVLNADKVLFSGNKWEEKQYYRHTGYPGGIKSRTAKELLTEKPTEILRKAVWGMTSKSHLARRQLMKLKIYAGTEHPHGAQNPKQLKISSKGKGIVHG